MKLLFNKENDGARQLQQLTGNYYANNNFAKIQMDIRLETEEIIKLIGLPVYQLAEDFYYEKEPEASGSGSGGLPSEDYSELVEHIQIAVAYKATFNFYQANIISHEDNGRKVKIDNENEKMPWEWMFDRDDQANQAKAYRMTDRLIEFLDQKNYDAWKESEFQINSRKLLVNRAVLFDQYFPIDKSGRFYYVLQPFISQVQKQIIEPAMGIEKFEELFQYWQKQDPVKPELEVTLLLAQEALVLKTMERAVPRLSIKVLPDGVVQQFKSMMQSRNASQAALDETLKRFVAGIKKIADEALDELKKHITPEETDIEDLDLLPKNDCNSKIFRT